MTKHSWIARPLRGTPVVVVCVAAITATLLAAAPHALAAGTAAITDAYTDSDTTQGLRSSSQRSSMNPPAPARGRATSVSPCRTWAAR
jgi:hypothetical protein